MTTFVIALPIVLVFLITAISCYFVGDNTPGMFIRMPLISLIVDLSWRWKVIPHGSLLLLVVFCVLAWGAGFAIAENIRQSRRKQFLTFKQQIYATELVFYSWFVVIICMVLAAGMNAAFGPLFSKSAAIFFHTTLAVAVITIMVMLWRRFHSLKQASKTPIRRAA